MKEKQRVEATVWFCEHPIGVDKIVMTTDRLANRFFKSPYIAFHDTPEGRLGTPFDSDSYSLIKNRVACGCTNYIISDRARKSNHASLSVTLGIRKTVGKMVECDSFNVISLGIETDLLIESPALQRLYLDSIKSMIEQFDPVFAAVDDIAVASDMLRRAGELTCYALDRIQTVYWGNYFGKEYCNAYGVDKLLSIPCFLSKPLANGVWLQINDSLCKTSWESTSEERRRIAQAFSIKLRDDANRERIRAKLTFRA